MALLNLFKLCGSPVSKSREHRIQMVGKGRFPMRYPIPRPIPSRPWGAQGRGRGQMILCALPWGLLGWMQRGGNNLSVSSLSPVHTFF